MSPTYLSADFYIKHGQRLCFSYNNWTNKSLIKQQSNNESLISALNEAPFVIVSHGIENDPIFNFGNKIALELFELDWDNFTQLPSCKSVEKLSQAARDKLMQEVTNNGFIDNYSGIRISSSGKRFLIEDAFIWNIIDDTGIYHGQAATFSKWKYLSSP